MIKSRYFLILVIFLVSYRAVGQVAETIYQGNLITTGYMNNLPLTSDGPFPVGFDFTFWGNTYSSFYVSENGRIMFNDPANFYSTESRIPNSVDLPHNFIAAFWDNLTVESSGNILYATVGAPPNRKLIVQFKNMNLYNPPTYLGTFAIILYETTNVIQTQFRQIVNNSSAVAHGSSAALGIENADGTAGIEYAYQSSTAAETGKVITYIPSGITYTVNTDAPYNWIYLTNNLSAPEPGIPTLLTPPQDAVIGSDYTFSWSNAGNVASYSLLISNSSDLGGSTIYPAGTNLSYNVTGLTVGATYYWGVFATNATGTTWCEIKKFTTSATPPLAAVPQTIYVEQTQDKIINLAYTGGDGSPKTALITTLPANGKLYQNNGGIKGAEIVSPPAAVTDPGMKVIYSATGIAGNNAGNFSYMMNDANGNSPTALITVNVTIPGKPNVVYFAKGTSLVEIQFDIPMADPTGKQNEFTVKSNGTAVTITSAALKAGDANTILLTTGVPLTDPVLVSYTEGTVVSSSGVALLTFTDQPVTLSAQTISFTQAFDLETVDSPVTLTATASSTLALTYSSSNLSVATVSGSVLTLIIPGTSEITARQAGNATFAPAKFIRTLTVTFSTGSEALPVKSDLFKAWYSNESLYISCPDDLSVSAGRLTVYDIQGKLISNNLKISLSPGQIIQESLPLPQGLYIIHIIINNKVFVRKVVAY